MIEEEGNSVQVKMKQETAKLTEMVDIEASLFMPKPLLAKSPTRKLMSPTPSGLQLHKVRIGSRLTVGKSF